MNPRDDLEWRSVDNEVFVDCISQLEPSFIYENEFFDFVRTLPMVKAMLLYMLLVFCPFLVYPPVLV